jgi:hypothetical protein
LKLTRRIEHIEQLLNVPVEPLNLKVIITEIVSDYLVIGKAGGKVNPVGVYPTCNPLPFPVPPMRVVTAEPETKRRIGRSDCEKMSEIKIPFPGGVSVAPTGFYEPRPPSFPCKSSMIPLLFEESGIDGKFCR